MSRRSFWALIYQLADAGVTVFVTTHYMDEAEYCDRLGLIYRGELIALGTPEELKGAIAEEIIEIPCDQPQAALAIVDALPGVRYAALFGRGLHAVTDRAGEAIPLITARLAAAGLAAGRPERIEPSLEDVFVSLIEARDRQMAPVTAVAR